VAGREDAAHQLVLGPGSRLENGKNDVKFLKSEPIGTSCGSACGSGVAAPLQIGFIVRVYGEVI
jgi:hypothetical protein